MDFVSFGPDYWDGPRHNRHYFCEELAKSHRVVFVSPPFYIVKLLREYGRGRLSPSGIRTIRPGLVNYVPSKALFTNFRFPRVNEWMENRRVATVRRIMRREGFRAPVLLIWHPQFRDMVGRFDESLVVYYVYDQYSGYVGGTPGVPDPAEVEMLRRADVVFVLSSRLYEDKKKYASNIHHLPNAVDFELFSKSRDAATPVPDDIAAIPAPRIGYIGTINEKVDVAMLEHVSSSRPDWSLVLIGRQNYQIGEEKERFFRLAARPNVHWLGPRPYDSVPEYIRGLDVCLMCYVINDWTYFGDPSKMHEYLASGKPTIATGLPAIREFSHVIDIPESHEEWVEAIEAGLGERDGDRVRRRIETALANSYPHRIEKALSIIRARLEERGIRA